MQQKIDTRENADVRGNESSALQQFLRESGMASGPDQSFGDAPEEMTAEERWELFTRFHRYLDWKEAQAPASDADEALRIEAARLALEPLSFSLREQAQLLLATSGRTDVAFLISGADLWAEPVIASALREFLLHGLRNALAHGFPGGASTSISSPEVRLSLGTVGDRVLARLADNGLGVDWNHLLAEHAGRTARRLEASELDATAALDLLCSPLVSTAAAQSLQAGSGWGLMGLRSRVLDLGGDLRITDSCLAPGSGFELEIAIPCRTLGSRCVREGERLFPLQIGAEILDERARSSSFRFFHRVSSSWFPTLFDDSLISKVASGSGHQLAALHRGELLPMASLPVTANPSNG